jgi:hypothetical protein
MRRLGREIVLQLRHIRSHGFELGAALAFGGTLNAFS